MLLPLSRRSSFWSRERGSSSIESQTPETGSAQETLPSAGRTRKAQDPTLPCGPVSGNRPQGGDGDVCLSVHSNRLFRDAPGPSLTATPRGRRRSVPTVPVPVTRGSASRLQPRARFHLPRGQSCVGGQLRPLTHARAAAETVRPAKPGLVTTRLSREYSASQSVPGPDRRPGSRFALRLSCFEL